MWGRGSLLHDKLETWQFHLPLHRSRIEVVLFSVGEIHDEEAIIRRGWACVTTRKPRRYDAGQRFCRSTIIHRQSFQWTVSIDFVRAHHATFIVVLTSEICYGIAWWREKDKASSSRGTGPVPGVRSTPYRSTPGERVKPEIAFPNFTRRVYTWRAWYWGIKDPRF